MSNLDDSIDGTSGDTGPRLSRSFEFFDKSEEYGTVGQTIATVVGGFFVFVGAAITAFGDAVLGLWIGLIDAFRIGGVAWIFAFTRDPAGYVQESFRIGALGFSMPGWRELGPFLPWVGVLVALGVVFMVTWYLDRRDSDVPGLGVDLFGVGNDEDGEPDDE